MGRIKKKGASIFQPIILSIDKFSRDIRAGQEFYYQNTSCAQASDLAPRLQTTVHIQGYGLLANESNLSLCNRPGIYPREPRNKKKASKSSTPSTTFYYTKDIQYLLHEPLLNKFRDRKALAKKIAKSLGRGEVGDAARLERKEAKITLDHIIKERYPTFVDALRDLDDALSMLFLFANLPSTSTVPPKTIAICQRLCHEFEHYLITTHSLRKSFLSIKGIYYQATVQGQDILWVVPYKFVQRVTRDVDFRIMGTFVEFYITLLGFVNFRLYTSIGLIYPPRFNASSDDKGGELSAFSLEGKGVDDPASIEHSTNANEEPEARNGNPDIQKQIDAMQLPEKEAEDVMDQDDDMANNGKANDTVDVFEPAGEGADILIQPQPADTEIGSIFAPFSFFLSRETPRHPLEFLLRAFGCKRISWDNVLGDGAFTHNEFDSSITHQVVDRPPLAEATTTEQSDDNTSEPPRGRMPGRTYIQPQWVWDCINEGKLLRPDLYAPGATLPPHLSPWVKPTKGAYDPSAPLAEQEREGEAEEAEVEVGLEDAESGEDVAVDVLEDPLTTTANGNPDIEMDAHGMDVADSDSEAGSEASAASSFDGFESDGVNSNAGSDDSVVRHQRELEAEAGGATYLEPAKPQVKGILKNKAMTEEDMKRRKALARKRKEEEEELERRKMMMGRKKRKLVDKMLYSNQKKDQASEKLRAKRRRIEKEKGKGNGFVCDTR